MSARWKWCLCHWAAASTLHVSQEKFAERQTCHAKNALFSFKMCHTNGEYERIGVHCIYAKKAFLVSTRQNLKFKFFFWGHGPQTFTRMWPWTPLGTSVPKTPWNPEPVQTLKPSYTPEHSTECCLKLHAGFKMCLYVIVATAAAPCGCLEVAGCCCWYRYFKQI